MKRGTGVMDAVKNRDDLLSIKEEYLRRQKSYQRQVLVRRSRVHIL